MLAEGSCVDVATQTVVFDAEDCDADAGAQSTEPTGSEPPPLQERLTTQAGGSHLGALQEGDGDELMGRRYVEKSSQNVEDVVPTQAADAIDDLDADVMMPTAGSEKDDNTLDDDAPNRYRQAWTVLRSRHPDQADQYAKTVNQIIGVRCSILVAEQQESDGQEF
eukprot:91747-Amphidinium_carterae.1